MTDIVTLASKGGDPLSPSEADGNLVELNRRTEHGWNDSVQNVTIQTGTNAPQLDTLIGGIVAHAFSAETVAECFANFHLRHDYLDGTMVYPHVHWTAKTNGIGVVRWGVEYTMARRGDSTGQVVFGQTNTLFIEQNVGPNEAFKHHVNESPDGFGIPGDILEVDSLILCRFFRDAEHPNDTFPDSVFLLTVDIHYQSDAMATPLRFPPFE